MGLLISNVLFRHAGSDCDARNPLCFLPHASLFTLGCWRATSRDQFLQTRECCHDFFFDFAFLLIQYFCCLWPWLRLMMIQTLYIACKAIDRCTNMLIIRSRDVVYVGPLPEVAWCGVCWALATKPVKGDDNINWTIVISSFNRSAGWAPPDPPGWCPVKLRLTPQQVLSIFTNQSYVRNKTYLMSIYTQPPDLGFKQDPSTHEV